jgi:alpha-L-fucosidase
MKKHAAMNELKQGTEPHPVSGFNNIVTGGASMDNLVAKSDYEAAAAASRDGRMGWWREARFGMFIHYGIYSLLERCEQVQIHECLPAAEYEALAGRFRPKLGCAREWIALARRAGMKYAVLTTKHHDGFCLWNTAQTGYNSFAASGRDLVAEFVEACRAEGLRVGFYHSLLDIHHPDSARAAFEPAARGRFLEFTQASLRELMTRYGRVDCLWYDVPLPFRTHEGWDSLAMNQMVRRLQPGIIINDRSRLPEDHDTPEGTVHHKPTPGRDWEACMTMNGIWGAMQGAAADTVRARDIVRMLGIVAAGRGNLLLNIGPTADGSVPPEAVAPLEATGRWLSRNGVAAYGPLDAGSGLWRNSSTGVITAKGSKAYFWCHWNGPEQGFGGLSTKLHTVRLLDGTPIDFTQDAHHVRLRGCPPSGTDPDADVTIYELEFEAPPVFAFRPLLPQLHQSA